MSKRINKYFSSFLIALLVLSSMPFTAKVDAAESSIVSFDFGSEDSPVADGYVGIHPGTAYSEEQGYGFLDSEKVTAISRESDHPLEADSVTFTETNFQVDVENGDYLVKIMFGDTEESTVTGVKANSIQKVQDTTAAKGEFIEKEFEIAVIEGKLSIQLTGEHPVINALQIERLNERQAAEHPSVYVVSDSTAQTYDPYWKPQAGWGQMLPRFFDEQVSVQNHAIGGRSTKTFYNEGRLDNVLREIKPNDYLLIQFGHNDATVSVPDRYTPVDDYKEYLRTYVNGARQRGAEPILLTPVNRRDFNKDTGIFNVSFPEYKQGMEEVASELDVLLIDLNTLSREFLNEIGPEGSKSVFLHADPGIYEAHPNGVADDTHFQEYGAIQIAGIIAKAIEKLDIPLANYVKESIEAEEIPAVPQDVSATNVSNAGALLKWTPSEGADIYRIYRKLADETEYQLVSTSTVPQLNLIGMEEGKTYDVVVTALNSKGESAQSEPIQIYTKTAQWKFDFGEQQNGQPSPVAEGYTEVNLSTLYTEELGYGIEDNTGMIARDRGEGGDLLRDWLGYFNTGWNFKVDLPNGLYAVKIYVGDYLGSARTDVEIEGKGYGTISASKNNVTEKVMNDVTIVDGQMNIYFGGATGIANGLEITPIYQAPTGVNLVEKNMDPDSPSVTIAWEEADDAKAYKIYRKVAGASKAEQVGEVEAAQFTDTDVVLGNRYEYTVTKINQANEESVQSMPLAVQMLDENVELPSVPQNVREVSVEKNELSIEWDEVEGAISYHVYRKAKTNGEFQLVGRTTEANYTDTSVLTSSPYYYTVTALNAGGESEQSEVLKTSAPTVLKKQMEDLDRAPIAVKTEEGVFISWRMLGTDSQDIAFHLYRDNEKITDQPIADSTNYFDENGKLDSEYEIRVVLDGKETKETDKIEVLENNHFDIPLQKPEDGVTPLGDTYTYHANDVSVGDVDGDGEYELIVKWDPSNSKDNSQSGYTGNVFVDAYKMDGTLLWRIDLGINIRAGAHYTQMLVYDFDGNGKAEVVMKTADGTVDGVGTVIGKKDVDHRNSSGYILQGDEFLTIFDGATGAAIDTVKYDPPRGNVNDWGDGYGNRVDRFLAGVAYLDGEHPSIVMTRGYYTRAVLAAYDFKDGKLEKRWTFDSNDRGNQAYAGQGYHSLSVADVDGDQKDEVVFGQMVIDDDGTGLYTTGLGHGDALHVGDFNPNREGLEVYTVQENGGAEYGLAMRDAETGEILWGQHTGRDTGRGLVADIDPRHEGAEAWAVGGEWNDRSGYLYTADGTLLSNQIPSANFAIWWDGDLLRELLDHDFDAELGAGVGKIDKWDYENEKLVNLLTADGTLSNNHTKGTPALQADLFGDWREEVIWRTEDSSALRVYTTTDVTEHRIFTLMHDPQYRVAIAWQNVGYNQPPHPSFYIGEGMEQPPMPTIDVVEINRGDEKVDTSELEALIAEAKAITNNGEYITSTYENLQRQIAKTEEQLSGIETEEQLQSIMDALQAAIGALVSLEDLNASYLLATVDQAKTELPQAIHRVLSTHLESVIHFEIKGETAKVVKHLQGFKQLLDVKKAEIPEEVLQLLVQDTDELINHLQK